MLNRIKKKGQVVVIVVLLAIVIFGIAGLAIDVGMIMYNKNAIQHSVDLTALSAADEYVRNHGQVVSTAVEFAKKNGLSTGEITIIHPYNGNENMIEIQCKRVVKLFFLPILGYKTQTVEAKALVEVEVESQTVISDQALKYAVFSGSTASDLQIKGTGSVVNGNVHGNKKVALAGSHTINGNLEGVGGVSGDLSGVSGTVTPKGAILPMPNLSFDYYASRADRIFTGNQIFNNIDINGIWLINGDVTLNGGRITGKGIILATGSISLPSNNLTYSSSDDLLALYSQGDITLSCTRNTIHGVLYAPNGTIRINGSYNTFYGALIANQVVWATKDIVINGDYDMRVPQAFIVSKPVIRLIK